MSAMAVDKPILIEHAAVKKSQIMGLEHQTLAGEPQGLTTLEIWFVSMPPGSETPSNSHFGEVVVMTLKGRGRALVDGESLDLSPHTSLIVPPNVTRQFFNSGEEDLEILVIRSLARPPEKTFIELLGSKL
jgi:mannose-6-phosphate isomerase-like protein (cupin superfamily)